MSFNDLLGLPVPTVLLILGAGILFLSLGGRLGDIKLPAGREVPFGVFAVVIIFIAIWLLRDEYNALTVAESPTPPPTEVMQVALLPETAAPEIAGATIPEEPPTAVPTHTASPTATDTAVAPAPPTNTVVPTATAVPPTNTSTPQPTATHIPTSTVTPEPTATAISQDDLFVVNLHRTQAVNIYTRDSDVTGAPLGKVDGGDVLEFLEQNEDGTWYKVRVQKNGFEGWIQKSYLVSGDTAVAVEPPEDETSENSEGSAIVPSTCLTTAISRVQWPDQFDDVTVLWGNWPDSTHRFKFSAWGFVNNQQVFLVEPAFVDTNEPSYEMGLWRFEERGFSANSTYSYRIEVLNANNGNICTSTGSFNN